MADQSAHPSNALGEHLDFIRKALKKPLAIIRCANPTCNKLFRQTRHWQKFHSVKCRTEKFWSEHERMTVPTNRPNKQPTNKTQ